MDQCTRRGCPLALGPSACNCTQDLRIWPRNLRTCLFVARSKAQPSIEVMASPLVRCEVKTSHSTSSRTTCNVWRLVTRQGGVRYRNGGSSVIGVRSVILVSMIWRREWYWASWRRDGGNRWETTRTQKQRRQGLEECRAIEFWELWLLWHVVGHHGRPRGWKVKGRR